MLQRKLIKPYIFIIDRIPIAHCRETSNPIGILREIQIPPIPQKIVSVGWAPNGRLNRKQELMFLGVFDGPYERRYVCRPGYVRRERAARSNTSRQLRGQSIFQDRGGRKMQFPVDSIGAVQPLSGVFMDHHHGEVDQIQLILILLLAFFYPNLSYCS